MAIRVGRPRFALAAIWLGAVGMIGCHATAAGPTVTSGPEIASAVRDLGSRDFRRREEAMRRLWEAGPAAETALEEAATSRDAEVRGRARHILKKFEYGIYPDTPQAVIREIERFRGGGDEMRQDALERLVAMDQLPVAMRLARMVENADERMSLTESIVDGARAQAPQWLIQGKADRLRRVLELAAITDNGRQRLAAFLATTGQINAALDRQRPVAELSEGDLRTRLYFLRAAGAATEAVTVARRLKEPELLRAALVEAGEWKEAAGIVVQRPGGGPAIEQYLELSAPFILSTLAGDRKQADALAQRLVAVAEQDEGVAFPISRTLLTGGRVEEALAAFPQQQAIARYAILRYQGRYREALEVIGYAGPGHDFSQYMNEALKKASRSHDDEKAIRQLHVRYQVGQDVAATLSLLGRKEQADVLLQSLLAAGQESEAVDAWDTVATMRTLDRKELALRTAAQALQKNESDGELRQSGLVALFLSDWRVASLLWDRFAAEFPSEGVEACLRRIDRTLHEPIEKNDELWKGLRPTIEPEADPFGDGDGSEDVATLATFFLEKNRRDLARPLMKEIASGNGDVYWRKRIAILSMQEKQWQEALGWLVRLEQDDEAIPSTMYLRGYVLTHLGRVEEGRRLMTAALILPLSDADERARLAETLSEAGLTEASLEQWRLVCRLTGPAGWYGMYAAQPLASAAGSERPAEAAWHWRQILARGAESQPIFARTENYLGVYALMLRRSAEAALKAGETAKAVALVEDLAAVAPGDTAWALDLIPLLMEAGERAAAEHFFQVLRANHLAVIEAFPKAAMHHNNLAWLAARTDRHLDEALALARRAVELAPQEAGYLDTLAEVHFRRGDVALAIELEKKCIEMDPEEGIFKEQLARFEARSEADASE